VKRETQAQILIEDTEGTAENEGISYEEGDSIINP